MFRIRHKDDEPKRCAYDLCNRKLRGYGVVHEPTGNVYCGEHCMTRDETEKAPPTMLVQ